MHNLVNLGYLSVRGDCFYIMKCVHSKSNPRQIPGRQTTESHLPACGCHEPTLTRMHSHTYTHITHAKLASESQPRLSSTNTAFSKGTLHTSRPHSPPATLLPSRKGPGKEEPGPSVLRLKTRHDFTYLDEVEKRQGEQVIHMSDVFGETI